MSILLIAISVAILQLTAVTYALRGPFTFNIALSVLVFFSLRFGTRLGLGLGLFFGAFNGLFATGSFWSNIFLYAAIGAVIGYTGRWFYKENLFVFLLMFFCSLLFIYFFHNPASLFKAFLPTAAYNIAISAFLFYFLRGLTG